MEKYAVIVAGGSGSRMGGGMPKQFRSLSGRPMLWWSLRSFHEENPSTQLIVVLPEDFISLWKDFFQTLPDFDRFEHKIACGGATRTESVINGLKLIDDPESLVAVHDGARPLVSASIIRKGWEMARESGAAIPVVAVSDSLRELTGEKDSRNVDRGKFRAVQTPQIFLTSVLKNAYSRTMGQTFTDDASAVESTGIKVILFEGSPDNIKVTTPKDMLLAQLMIENTNCHDA